MKPLIIFQFDKMVEICPKKIPVTMKEIFFRPLPSVHLHSNSEDLLKLAQGMGMKTMLLAYENEIFVKESLFALKIFHYFDEFLLINEYYPDCPDPELFADFYISKYFQSKVLYAHEFANTFYPQINTN